MVLPHLYQFSDYSDLFFIVNTTAKALKLKLKIKINRTHLSSCRLVEVKPCESITECSRVPQLSEHHYCWTLLYSVIDSQGFPTVMRLLRW